MKTMWSIDIKAPRERVWRALTAPGEVQPFYFGSRFDGGAAPGDEYRYTSPDRKRVFISGTIIDVIPNERFAHTFRFTDLPEPEQRVVFELSDVAGGTRVTIRHEGLASAPKHRKRVTPGWDRILSNLKHWLEQSRLPLGARVQNAMMSIFVPLMGKAS